MNKSLLYFLIILLVLLLSVSFFWIYESRVFISRAGITRTSFSVDNSYVFATPLKAKADGLEKIRATVFVLNNQGLGVMGKKITIEQNSNLLIETVQGLTDQSGKAVFEITSDKAGDYYLGVKVEKVPLPQKVKLSYY